MLPYPRYTLLPNLFNNHIITYGAPSISLGLLVDYLNILRNNMTSIYLSIICRIPPLLFAYLHYIILQDCWCKKNLLTTEFESRS